MDTLYDIIKNKLKLDESERIKLEPQPSGWYIIRKSSNLKHRHYNLGVRKRGFNYVFYIKNFVTGNKTEFSLTSSYNLKLLDDVTTESTIDIHDVINNCLKIHEFKDNGYLQRKKLTDFDITKSNIITMDYYKHKNMLMIPYTSFADYPKYSGAKLIASDGDKRAIKGSRLKNSFHAHRYNKELNAFIIGEGFPECFIAANLLETFNVLEAGGMNNVGNLLTTLIENPNNIIYVLAEHGSENVYDTIIEMYPSVKVTYPPDKDTKDFGDYYIKAGREKTKEALLGLLLEQSTLGYKPLGIEHTIPVFYSKLIKGIVKIPAEHTDAVYRLMTKNPYLMHKDKTDVKKAAISRLFMECAQCGTYTPDNVLPVGLWSKDKSYFYNDGTKVLKVEQENLTTVTYDDAIRADFLLYKVPSSVPIDTESKFTDVEKLAHIMSLCDWAEPVYSKLLLGFLTQSYFAGSIQFRPHMWIMSDATHQGKTWISSWCSEHLVTNCKRRESGRSSSAGAAQDMATLAGLLVADEFAEEGTTFISQARQMIELLRSAATSRAPIVMGSPDQKPIKSHAKFSALLACIEGTQLLRRQDYDRIIILKLIKGEGTFVNEVEPLFRQFIKDNNHKGFAAHALKGWYIYKNLIYKLNKRLEVKYKNSNLGHKIRGIASILAGYAVYTRDVNCIDNVLEELEGTPIVKPYLLRQELYNEDIVERILRTEVLDTYTPISDRLSKTIFEVLNNDATGNRITSLGLVYEKPALKIYCSEFRNFNDRYLKMNIKHVYKMLADSKYFNKFSSSNFNGKRTNYYLLNLKEFLKENT